MEFSHQNIRASLLAGLALNLALAGGKLCAGWQLGGLALLADALYSLLLAAADLVALAALQLPSAPVSPLLAEPPAVSARREKFAALAAPAVGAVLLLAGWELAAVAVQTLPRPALLPTFSAGGILFLLAALGADGVLARCRRLVGVPPSLSAAGVAGFKIRLGATALTVTSLLSAKLGWPRFDAVAALVIIGAAGLSLCRLVRDHIDRLAAADRGGRTDEPARHERR
jgi:divalent metal cation (Fe/Co/Zn/Cd) transporter